MTTQRQDRPSSDSGSLTVAEEIATVGVARRDLGGVRVRVVTDTVEEMRRLALSSERVEITHHPVEREVETVPAPREDGDLTIIPVVEERAVVVTRLFVTEEIHIRRVRSTETVDVPLRLRRQRAEIDRLDPDPSADPTL